MSNLDDLIKKVTDEAYKSGRFKSILISIYISVDHKHIPPSLLKSIKQAIQ